MLTRSSSEVVSHLLSPLGLAEFVGQYLEKKPLHVPRAQPGYYDRWMTLASFQDLLCNVDSRHLNLKESKQAYEFIPSPPLTLQQALDAFRGGSTLVANSLHHASASMATLCRHLELFFHHPFQMNSYMTPGGTSGFKPHFDDHDVFLFQITGRKRWKVYAPQVELPLPEQLRSVTLPEESVPLIDAVIEPGDMLYMPRGFIHSGTADGDEVSLHLTAGMVGVSWRDAIVRVIQSAALQETALRRFVPLSDPELAAAQMEETVRLTVQALREDLLGDVSEWFAMTRPAVDPEFPTGPLSLQPDTRIERHPLVSVFVREVGGQLLLYFNGKSVPMPKRLEVPLRFILAQEGPFAVRDIPAAMNWLRINIAELLLKEGVLRPAR